MLAIEGEDLKFCPSMACLRHTKSQRQIIIIITFTSFSNILVILQKSIGISGVSVTKEWNSEIHLHVLNRLQVAGAGC